MDDPINHPIKHWLTAENVQEILARYPQSRTFFEAYNQGVMSYSSMLCLIIELMFNYSLVQEHLMEAMQKAKHKIMLN